MCIPHGYQPASFDPENINFIERDLLDANPRDHEWRKQFFANLPHYLGKYFAKRYEQIGEKQGYAKANTYLREKMQPAVDRVRKVLLKYKHLPTTQKVALLSETVVDENHSTDQNDFDYPNKQQSFDFDQAEKNRTPVSNRLLAELEQDELKEMALKISNIVNQYWMNMAATKYSATTEQDVDENMVLTYEAIANFVSVTFGMKAPRKYKKQTPLSATTDLSKMICDKWWLGRLSRSRKIMREHLAIAIGQVSSRASAYASWDCIREHKAQLKRNWDAIQKMLLTDEETGEEVDAEHMVLKSVSNPAIRRHELMVRCRGCEDIGDELGLQGLFLTLTTPAAYHNSYKKGGFIDHWNGASPKDAQDYLTGVWSRIRSKLGRLGIRWFGVRVAEPHHDGTPHWHLLIWVNPADVLKVTDIFIRYAVKENTKELLPKAWPLLAANYVQNTLPSSPFRVYPKVYANNFPIKKVTHRPTVELPEHVQQLPMNQEGLTTLNIDYSARCDVQFIDPEQGTATGYIAKYISKNIDGYAMDGEVSDETGKPVGEMAKNVSAWKSRWAIRQFQFFGGAPVTTYRELRRFANQNKKAFMEYVFMQTRVDLLTIYSMLMRDLVGPIKPSRLISHKELLDVIGNSYESRFKSNDPSISDTLKAADHGDWQGYIMGQGGPFVARDALLIRNSYEELPFASPHGETVRKLEGFDASGVRVKTRTKKWVIGKKKPKEESLEKLVSCEFDKPSACPSTWKFRKKVTSFVPKTEAEGSALDLHGASGSSRSSVNNCTRPENPRQVRELSPLIEYEISRLIDEYELADSFRNDLFKGHWISLSKEKSIKLRQGDTDRTPDNLVYHTKHEPDLSWLGEVVPIPMVGSHYQPLAQDNYQQPNLSFFGQEQEQTIPWADYINQLNQDHEEWPIG
ncbi:replication endonuclease [uncultured Vibrio sp.]|uniref:replication endonuclease n=1 Tax=uncultured Vibrio sp. TaxID=114054 RepID=UPI0025F10C58|nr:replication endonuclease [uncultured Vibrio sp.]